MSHSKMNQTPQLMMILYIESLSVVRAEEAKLLNTFSESYDLQKLYEQNAIFLVCAEPLLLTLTLTLT